MGKASRRLSAGIVICLALALGSIDLQAFQLRPTGTDDEQIVVKLESGLWGTFWSKITRHIMAHFSNGVHEEVTNRIWGCDLPAGAAVTDQSCKIWNKTPASVLYGVQWSDNPPFKLDSTNESECTINSPIRLPDRQPNCWRILFGDASQKASEGTYLRQSGGWALLYRSHFGDLQFLHSMASWNGETMRDTKARILMWAEFTYLVSTKAIAPETLMSQIQVPGFRNVLGRYWGDVSSLFTYGVRKYASEIPDVAFGSLLHMVEDSFSKSHVSREYAAGVCSTGADQPNAGRVIEFHAYGNQDSDSHDKQDSRDLMLAAVHDLPTNNVITVGRHLKALRDGNAPWADVRKYLDECVYAITEDDLEKPAGPGPYK